MLFSFGDNSSGQLGVGKSSNISNWCVQASEHASASSSAASHDAPEIDDDDVMLVKRPSPPHVDLPSLTTKAALLEAVRKQVGFVFVA